jgi:hypothetical protein
MVTGGLTCGQRSPILINGVGNYDRRLVAVHHRMQLVTVDRNACGRPGQCHPMRPAVLVHQNQQQVPEFHFIVNVHCRQRSRRARVRSVDHRREVCPSAQVQLVLHEGMRVGVVHVEESLATRTVDVDKVAAAAELSQGICKQVFRLRDGFDVGESSTQRCGKGCDPKFDGRGLLRVVSAFFCN